MPEPHRQPTQDKPRLGPRLVPAQPGEPRRHTALALWHLLSLDAPSVAALWTYFLARCCHVALPWIAPAAMFLAVWMIYAADRLLDARLLDIHASVAHPELEERHRFHHRHRAGFRAFLVLASLMLVTLLLHIDTRSLELYMLLATLLGTWMLLIHIRPHSSETQRLPKELAVGIFFPAACFIPTIARAPALQITLLPAAALFAGVCTLNCLFLFAWEHPDSEHTQQPAHWTTLWATHHLAEISIALLLAGAVLALGRTPAALPALACDAAIALLLLLHRLRLRISAVHLRAAADLVLLTPLLFLLHR